jgi:hypothetical protein
MPQPSYRVYIDESGDEGFDCAKGASQWFVLSAAVTRASTDLETVKLVDTVRTLLNRPAKKPLHFRDLRHEHRIPFIDHIARARLRVLSVLVHKPSIVDPETFQDPHRLYFYAVRYLLERVSWLCRDRRDPEDGDGTAEIVFSNRSSMSYDELRSYFKRLEAAEPPTSIDWSAIRCDQMVAFAAGKRMGLQIADAVAYAFFRAVEPTAYGHTEDRYARMLRPVVYNQGKIYKGYGIKLWPGAVESSIQGSIAWLKDSFSWSQGPRS